MATSDGIEHFNGTDIQLLLSQGSFNYGIVFDKDVVLLNPMTQEGDLIYHGKLK